MNIVVSWLRNNLVTVVEFVNLVYDAAEVIVNGAMRLLPGNTHVIFVHDILAKIQGPLKGLKDFLLQKAG